MLRIFQTEFIKSKDTFVRWLTAIIPIFCVWLLIFINRSVKMNGVSKWDMALCLLFNWWSAMLLPLTIALICSLVNSQEKKSGNYRTLRLHYISPANIWIGKIFIIAFYMFVTSVIFLVATIIAGRLLIGGGQIPLNKIISAIAVIWITSLAIIPVQLFISTWKGTALSIVVATAGVVLAVVTMTTKLWYLVPWNIAPRLMCPIVRVNVNGLYIKNSANPLLDKSVISLGIISALCMFLVFTLITSFWFSRREVK
ncbi:lantibiotic immunity ABC transporter MutE/EpiE family permease subunit [Clostridium oryzae]|uniref:ABC-2 family transporter protein n=1 Tax=Clostridium oryzae TaxID=1450648 RepID=A0A1V4IGT9_9CLOT|nr:lantibiotic immunity ABC transporter MutE/EpiE family permease subunit [Clostridium oryzae]OPJ59173.1 ABC-2 family transporter protein [Clostridium oryzae]